MKKKEKGKLLEKKRAPKGTARGGESKRRKKDKRIKEEKKGVSEKQLGKKTEEEKKKTREEEVKKETPEEIKPKKKLIKKIEKIAFPPKKEEVKRRKKKPKFKREGNQKTKNLEEKWRKPRGIDSKKHVGKRGKGKVPKIGYKNPEAERGLVRGLRPKHVYNPSQLRVILTKEEGVIISSKVGRKKRNEIIKEANKLKITILNPKKDEL